MIWVEPRRKKETGETWVLNEAPNLPGGKVTIEAEIQFTSNNEAFSKFIIGGKSTMWRGAWYDDRCVWDPLNVEDAWGNSAYRTVTFHEAPSGDLFAWLQENAVKQ